MVAHARGDKGIVPEVKGATQLYGFPDGPDLPIVVATRMSLSFPILLSAVPLYAVDFSLRENQEKKKAGTAPRAERCWFSDGGICSIHCGVFGRRGRGPPGGRSRRSATAAGTAAEDRRRAGAALRSSFGEARPSPSGGHRRPELAAIHFRRPTGRQARHQYHL